MSGAPAAPPLLTAQVVVRRGTLQLDVSLRAAAGEVVAVLGPNGAGKTTLLRALAGLVPLREGRVELDGTCLEDAGVRRRVPTEQRPVGVVFQDYLLFPHLSALDNVAFGLRCRGAGRGDARAVALDWLTRVGLAEQARFRPSALSGGQAQRVALARALAGEPRLLLLDEPLAALDAATRLTVRSDLRRHLAAYAGATVLVTHDALEALTLADRLVVVEDGRVVQSGSPGEVAGHPRTAYVARLVGLNLYRGRATDRQVAIAGGGVLTVPPGPAGEVFAAIRPSSVALHRTRPEGSPRNVWTGTVDGLELHGDLVRVGLAGTPSVIADVTPAAVAELHLRPGESVWASVKATEIAVYPA
ncbi:MAG: ABC transporter ATP-binding protein [Actinomycetota bacterium]|nr:ABC transporter ATP-binding protein [Actinomycetota bacterium]